MRNSRSVFLIVFDGKVCGGVERKRKYRIWLMAALVVNLIVLAGFVMNNWYQEAQKTQDQGLTKVSADVADRHYVMPVGMPVGLYIHTKGVMVLGTGKVENLADEVMEPAKTVFRKGDYILSINGTKIRNTSQAMSLIQACKGNMLNFEVLREGDKICLSMKPVETAQDVYKIGVWLRDDTQGIGTITYVDANQQFAALGHGITDADTGILMDISHGMVYRSNILSVVKGSRGTPGEIVGTIDYQKKNRIGTIDDNSGCGIFGTIDSGYLAYDASKAVPVAHSEEVMEGPAAIVCTVNGETESYEAEIRKIDRHNRDHKNFVLQITDERLLAKTNGILQGMSGSPVIQNGQLAGAVTHVFVNEPTKGYGIFAENMQKTEE